MNLLRYQKVTSPKKFLEQLNEIRTTRPLDEEEQDMLLIAACRLDAVIQNMLLDLQSTIQVAETESQLGDQDAAS